MNKKCYYAVILLLYRDLAIHISSREKLRRQCAEIENQSQGSTFLIYARHVKVFGRMPTLEEESDPDPEEIPYVEQDDAEFWAPFGGDLDDGTAEEVGAAWNPLALLLQKFQHISDFIWVCRNQLPSNILQAIEQHYPSCRLHMRTFRLKSLTSSGATDPAEQSLIQSPNLYSITIRVRELYALHPIDYNAKAIYQVIALAPNLKHLVMVGPHIASHGRRRGVRVEAWKGFESLSKNFKQGSLESFVHIGLNKIDLDMLLELSRYTDLSKIRHLDLGQVVDPQILAFMNQSLNFDSLETLCMNLSPTRGTDQQLMTSLYESLLERLPPLLGIRLGGCLTYHLTDKVLQRHGPTLRRSFLGCRKKDEYPLQPPSSKELIQWYETHCPALEHVSITVPYPSSNASLDDCSIADFCPNLESLRELELVLDGKHGDLPLKEVARKIWDFIDREGVCHLRSLFISEYPRNVGIPILDPLPPY